MDLAVDVAVIGGGLAGLAAAERLQREGREPVVFEATDRVGGRQRTTKLAGEVLEEGAVFFGSNYPVLQDCLRRTGLSDQLKTFDPLERPPLPVGEAINEPGRRGRASPTALMRSRRIPWNEALKLAPFGATLRLQGREIRDSLGNPESTALARRLDGVDAEDYLRRRVGPAFVEWFASPFLEALGFAPARDWSALGALQILVFAGMAQLYGIEAGNDELARRLATDLEVRFEALATALAPAPAGVELEIADAEGSQTIGCRDVVLAIPAPATRRLLSGALREAVGRFRYSSSVVIAVGLEDLAIELPASSVFGGPDGYGRISGMVAERSRPGAPVIAYGALRHPWQYEMFEATDDEVVPLLTDVLDEANGSPVQVLEERVVRWKHSVPVTAPGSIGLRRAALALAAEQPHLFLAGDWIVSPSQEGALVSGLLAADSLLDG